MKYLSILLAMASVAMAQTFTDDLRLVGTNVNVNFYEMTPPLIRFTVIAQDTDDLDMTAATLTAADFIWGETGTLNTTNTLSYDMGVSALGAHYVVCSDWSAVTKLDWNRATVSGNIAYFGTATGLTYLRLDNTGITGDLASTTLPTGLTTLHLYNTGITGDLASTTLPTGLTYLHLGYTSITGDLASTTLPAGLTYLNLGYTGTTYPSSTGSLTNVANNINFQIPDCTLSTNNVDNILVDLDTSGATGGVANVAGDNAAPSATGLTAFTNLIGKNWSVTKN